MKDRTRLLIAVMLCSPVCAETLIVDPTIPAPVPPNVYATIQDAIDASSHGDRIEVASGLYTGSGDSVIDTSGKAITVVAPFGATIWGAGQRTCVSCTSGESADTVIEGFILHQGDGGDGELARGGGLHIQNSSPTILDCGIVMCASTHGGAVQIRNSNATLHNCDIRTNSATEGGGCYLDDFDGSITDCSIVDNIATGHGGGVVFTGNSTGTMDCCEVRNNNATNWNAQGGGMYVHSGAPQLHDCKVSDNAAGDDNDPMNESKGGGLYLHPNSMATVSNCEIDHNHAVEGGGIFIDNSPSSMHSCSIHNNNGITGGGLYINDAVGTSLDGCTIWQNTSSNSAGGGLYCTNSAPLINQCTISHNISPVDGGGGVYLHGSNAVFQDCVLSDNQACCGGGVLSDNQDASVMRSCHFANNHAFINGGGAQCAGAVTTTFDQCDFQENTVDGSFAGIDAGQDAAGPILTGSHFCSNGAQSIGGLWISDDDNVRADIDGANGVSAADLIMLVGNWTTPNQASSIDTDLDGLITVKDLLVILEHWGDCSSETQDVVYKDGLIDDMIDDQPGIEPIIDPISWSATFDFPEYTSTITADQAGGSMTALYGTSQPTWPRLSATVELRKSTTLHIDGFAQIFSNGGTKFYITRLSNCGNESVESINFGNALDGPEIYNGSIEDLPPGTYRFRLEALLGANGSVGSGIGVSWTYE